MPSPEIKFEEGKLQISVSHTVDADQDGKASAKVSLQAEVDAAEVISEIAKKDMGWLETLLLKLKG